MIKRYVCSKKNKNEKKIKDALAELLHETEGCEEARWIHQGLCVCVCAYMQCIYILYYILYTCISWKQARL